MSIARAVARLLLREAPGLRCSGSLLELGRQTTYLTPAELARYASTAPRPDGSSASGFVASADLYEAMGYAGSSAADLPTVDADIAMDLNLPIDAGLHGHFDAVIDGGTLPYVFDVPRALDNVRDLLRAEGLAIHITAVSGYMDQRLYSFSPALLRRYYAWHGYQLERLYLARSGLRWERGPWRVSSYSGDWLDRRRFTPGSGLWHYILIARKPAPGGQDPPPDLVRQAPSDARPAPGRAWLSRHPTALRAVRGARRLRPPARILPLLPTLAPGTWQRL